MNFRNTTSALALSFLAAATAASSAVSISVLNYSFEEDIAPNPGVVTSVPTGWTSFFQVGGSDIGSQNPDSAKFPINNPLAAPADGNQFVYINTFGGNPNGRSGIYQPITDLMPNMTYTLTVAIGSRLDRDNSAGTISLVDGFDHNGTILATGGGLPETKGTWQDYSISFTTGDVVNDGFLTIVLSTVAADTIQADFDNVRLEAVAVPEPTTAALIAASCGAFLILRRRKRAV